MISFIRQIGRPMDGVLTVKPKYLVEISTRTVRFHKFSCACFNRGHPLRPTMYLVVTDLKTKNKKHVNINYSYARFLSREDKIHKKLLYYC